MNTTKDILRMQNNSVAEGIFLINDIKLKPFMNGKEGYFLVFNLQDKEGLVASKIWDNAEVLAQQLKAIKFAEVKGRTSLYNNKIQLVVDKIREAEKGSYNEADLIRMASKSPEDMWNEIVEIFESLENQSYFKDLNIIKIWEFYKQDEDFLQKFKMWPGGKGIVHHAYQHGLLEHTLSVIKLTETITSDLQIDFYKARLGAFLHDIGKIDAYDYDLKTSMTNFGRLHEHSVLGYYRFRKDLETIDIPNKEIYAEEIGHIILSHHGSREHGAIVAPMTVEARLVAFADQLDSDVNYGIQQVEHNADEFGWVFDNLNEQFYFKRPKVTQPTLKRRKMI